MTAAATAPAEVTDPTAGSAALSAALLRIVVVTFSPGSTLDTFLDSLAAASHRRLEVVLADNGSVDGAPERAAARPGVRLLRTGGNLGYGRAANTGAAGAAGRWVVVANPDIEWAPGSLDALIAAADRWPRAGAMGPAIRTAHGALYPSARAFPSLGRGLGHAAFGWWWPANPWTASYRRERGAPAEGSAGWLSGSCLLLRREAFEAVGGFDPSYFMYCEDMDLCRRLAEAGWLNIYAPTAVVTHAGGSATSQDAARMLAEHHRSLYRYLARQYAGRRFALLRLALGIGLALRYLLARLVGGVAEGAAPTRSADLLGTAADSAAG